jgi:hypothetical protein
MPREKCQVTYKGKPIRITADLSAEILEARRPCTDVSVSSHETK